MNRSIRIAALASVACLLMLAARVGLDTWSYVGRKIPGLPLLDTGILTGQTLTPARLRPYLQGIRPHDRVTAMNGEPVGDGRVVWQRIDALPAGSPVEYLIERKWGDTFTVTVPVTVFTADDFGASYVPFALSGLAYLVIGLAAVLLRPALTAARLVFLFFLGFAAGFDLLPFDSLYAFRLVPWVRLGGCAALGALIHLAFVFPQRRWPFATTARVAAPLLWTATGAFAVAFVASGYRDPGGSVRFEDIEIPLFMAAGLILTANVIDTAYRAPDARRQQQARVVLPAPLLFGLMNLTFILTDWFMIDGARLPAVTSFLCVATIALLFTYALVKQNVFEFDAVVRRGVALGILGLGAVCTYLAVFLAAYELFGATAAGLASVVPAAAVLVLGPTVVPLRVRLEGAVERWLFPGQREARRSMRRTEREVSHLRDETELVTLVRRTIADALTATSVRLVTGTPGQPMLESAPQTGPGTSLSLDDPLHRTLAAGQTSTLDAVPAQGGPTLAVPLPPTPDLVGGLLLGFRADGRLYTSDDQQLLETLAAQVASALRNTRAWDEVQRLQQRLATENTYLREEAALGPTGGEIAGQSVGIRALLAQIEQVAPTDAAVLVQGESGTGKELVVRALHEGSRRHDRALVKIACAAIPEALLESELFGHERGAFTGATDRKIGRFAVADGGTIFFDDVDTLPMGVQAKLLRAIQEGEVQRLGSTQVEQVNVRVIAATNRDLPAEIVAGRFREDLYYRLNVIPLFIPPLRDRRDDIPLLVERFIALDAGRAGRSVRGIAPEALAELMAYHWPGNVRELRNVIERALVLGTDEWLRLPAPLAASDDAPRSTVSWEDRVGTASLADLLREYKTTLLRRALERTGGNQRAAAELLGLHRPSLNRMLKELDLAVAATPTPHRLRS